MTRARVLGALLSGLLLGCQAGHVVPTVTPAADDPRPPNGTLAEIISSDPAYGGLWRDGSVMNVWVVGDVDAFVRRLEPRVPAGVRMNLLPARYTFDELEAVMAEVIADTSGPVVPPGGWPPAWNPDGITFIDADERRNRVVVGIWPYTLEAAERLARRYGPAVEVVQRALARH